MTNASYLTWLLSLMGIRSALAHHEILEVIEVCRAFGCSYRLACSGAGSALMCVRLAFNYFKAIALVAMHRVASPRAMKCSAWDALGAPPAA